ncbi:MAG TPA: ComEC/Rec2 family competence protein [Candidatus Kapabacteria bacterium]|nr:ComEC/Rec2 family competence protein [Candidatus Kapabacteria bacterium]
MFENIRHSKSKTFLAFCFCFLAGVALQSFLLQPIPFLYLYGALFVTTSFLVLHRKERTARFVLFCFIFILLGMSRYILAFPGNETDHVRSYDGQIGTFIGYVGTEPDIRLDGVRYFISVSQEVKTRSTVPVHGKIYVKSDLYPRFVYGDVVTVTCTVKKPEPIEDFRFDMYLARSGVFALCIKPRIEKIGNGEGNILFRSILGGKQVIADRINALWHEPYASFMAGILYGYRGGLGDLTEAFKRTGLSHVVAVSGTNITIIASAFFLFLVKLVRMNRKRAFWCMVGGIMLFVIFTGMSASVVRAGIMGILALVGTQMGRATRPEYMLTATATLMVLHNPFVLVWDAGFQLSFLATMGLFYIAPVLKQKYEGVPEYVGIKESLLTTCSAILITLPLLLYQFGTMSIVAPLVNLLVVWTIPYLMAFGFVAIVGSVLPFLGTLLAWTTWMFLFGIIFIVRWFASLPFAAINLTIPLWGMVLLYVILWRWVRRQSTEMVYTEVERL